MAKYEYLTYEESGKAKKIKFPKTFGLYKATEREKTIYKMGFLRGKISSLPTSKKYWK